MQIQQEEDRALIVQMHTKTGHQLFSAMGIDFI